jgi:hypothetical protein
MRRPTFRTGQLHACPVFLEAVERSAMISAIVAHATTQPTDGQPVCTEHEHGGWRFYLETDADREKTVIRLI